LTSAKLAHAVETGGDVGLHANAPLTPEGRRRLVERIDEGRPISHVAAEAGVSRQRLGEWYRRWQKEGEAGLEDRSSRPSRSPNVTSEELGDHIEAIRREKKWGPDRISGYLAGQGISISPATVHRELRRRGINRRRDLDPPTGENMRQVIRYEKGNPGDQLHIDIKKVGKIPRGGGWRVHGRDSEQGIASKRKVNRRPGYTYIHAAVDDHSRLAYAECHENEQAVTAVEFLERALIFFATHGIDPVREVLTDNGSAYISSLWKHCLKDHQIKHRRTRRQTPRTNGKVERFNQTMKDEWLYVRAYISEEQRREALIDFLNDYNHDRPHTSIGNRPPISRAPKPGARLTAAPVVIPEDVLSHIPGERRGQLSFDNNVPRVS
jgi:transposase InsO family protein